MDGKKKSRERAHGFSLIELFAVIAIIGILAGIAVPIFQNYLDKARLTVSLSMLDSIRKELEVYQIQNSAYPVTINFADFTDQNGNTVLSAVTPATVHAKIFSLDSYEVSGGTYTITVKAIDSNHTVLTLTPVGTKKW